MRLPLRTPESPAFLLRLLLIVWSLANISAATDTPPSVNLAWNANPEADIAGYRVQYGTVSGNLTLSQTVGTTPAATLTDLEPGILYYCAVRAFNTSVIEGPLSAEISFVIPATTGPEISVERASGGDLLDGRVEINLGVVALGSTGAPQTLVISNLGTTNLTDLAITTNGAEFAVTPLSTTTLAPGETTSFNVTFIPSAGGTRSASLRITSNDEDENPFDIALTGTSGTIPDISVTHAGGIDLTVGGAALNLRSVTIGDAESVGSFSIANLGTANLSDLKITLGGPHDSDFTVDLMTGNSLAPGAATTVQVAFNPTAAGSRTATLQIASNDPDEAGIQIVLAGIGVAAPQINVPEIFVAGPNGAVLADAAGIQEFGEIYLANTGEARTYTLSNSGTANLTGLAISTGGAHAADFIVSSLTVTSLAPGSSTTLRIAFRPSAGGTRIATLRIASNDPGTSSFEIALRGSGIASPEITVYRNDGTSLTSGSGPLSFGNCNLGTTTRARTFTIKNTGSTMLAGLSVASDGPDFNLGIIDSTSLAPGASTNFKVSFQPSVAGTRGTRLVIASNDADEGQFMIDLTGIGIEVPEIGVELSSGKSLTDNESVINSGTVDVGSTARSRTFTIRNTGTANLDGLGIVKNGIHSPDFRVSALRTRSLAPGASTTFKIHFSPAKAGIRWVGIRIISNDADERSFDIVLAGTGRKSSGATAATTSVPASQTTRAFRPVKRIELIDGRKYLTLTITKTPGTTGLPSEVEVSSNLVDWSSGTNHTTVLLDNATTFKVRDNTPVSQNAKRYIRLKR